MTAAAQLSLFDVTDRIVCPTCSHTWSGERPKSKTYWWLHRRNCWACARDEGDQ